MIEQLEPEQLCSPDSWNKSKDCIQSFSFFLAGLLSLRFHLFCFCNPLFLFLERDGQRQGIVNTISRVSCSLYSSSLPFLPHKMTEWKQKEFYSVLSSETSSIIVFFSCFVLHSDSQFPISYSPSSNPSVRFPIPWKEKRKKNKKNGVHGSSPFRANFLLFSCFALLFSSLHLILSLLLSSSPVSCIPHETSRDVWPSHPRNSSSSNVWCNRCERTEKADEAFLSSLSTFCEFHSLFASRDWMYFSSNVSFPFSLNHLICCLLDAFPKKRVLPYISWLLVVL